MTLLSHYPISAGGPRGTKPMGWHWHRLLDIARLESGHTPSRSRADWWDGGNIPWLALPDIRALDGKIALDTQEHTNEHGIANSSARILPPGTVCLSRTASVGFVTILGKAMATSQDFANWICGPELIPDFLLHALRASRRYLLSLASGAVHKTIYMPELRSLFVCAPVPEEQRRIAIRVKEQLASVAAATTAIDSQFADAETLSAAILRDAFSPLLAAPKGRIGDFAPTGSGTTPSRDRKDYWRPATIPWVKTGEVAFEPIVATEEHISELALRHCSLQLLPPGTVLVAMYGQGKTRGQSAVLRIPATINQACFAIMPNSQWEPEFMQLWLHFSYSRLRSSSDARGGNQSNLNGKLLQVHEVPLIAQDRQQVIVKSVGAALAEAKSVHAAVAKKHRNVELLASRILEAEFSPQNA